MKQNLISQLGNELYQAMQNRVTIAPLTSVYPDMSIEDAYHISLNALDRRLADGAQIVGKKIGVTSLAVQQMLNVHQPDFGFLTDDMMYNHNEPLPVSKRLIQPRAEGELAFILKHDLKNSNVTNADVIAATDYVTPCFEIVDSRIKDWQIKIQDTVADNASCGLFVLGDEKICPDDIDFSACKMTVEKNGEVISTGLGSAALGSPVNCVTWLANTLGAFGISLNAGDIILSGSLVPLEPVVAGDTMKVTIDDKISTSVTFI